MRILLVGEYSNFHNSLKYGLEFLGHDVVLLGDGDGFKNYPVDIDLSDHYYNNHRVFRKLEGFVRRLTGWNIADRLRWSRFRESEKYLKDHDIVQFINSNAMGCNPTTEKYMIDFLLQNNHSFFLVAAGDDCEYADFIINKHEGYNILEAIKTGQQTTADFYYTYKYLKPAYRENYDLLVEHAQAVIPINTDYAMALHNQSKAVDLIPAPVQCGRYHLDLNADVSTIEIFLGINSSNYWKKGVHYFEKALETLQERYQDKIKVTKIYDMPYTEYIKSYKRAHIVLDQVLGYDQGYNALEAMLQGKVVFTGGGSEFLKARHLESVPVIDARPDVPYLIEQLELLIENPKKILELGIAARNHVIHHHESVAIAQKYVALYQTAQNSI